MGEPIELRIGVAGEPPGLPTRSASGKDFPRFGPQAPGTVARKAARQFAHMPWLTAPGPSSMRSPHHAQVSLSRALGS